ncbi:sigma factor-like helix-turn-helix DNA-binding protein [Clostridium subterminale]|uniref:Sigma factor-like helix-turn-helix DNA-binding protein n=1 Tax=Clostridium subterminale TaxID=1550 RepID=A0ABP3VT28_CLOSU
MNMNKKIETMLYNFNQTKAEIKNIKLDIELLENEYDDGIGVNYVEKTGKTNKITSTVENMIIRKEAQINRLNYAIKVKEAEIKKIENALEILTDRERSIIEMRYFHKESNRNISAKLYITEEYVSAIKSKAIKSLVNIFFLNSL